MTDVIERTASDAFGVVSAEGRARHKPGLRSRLSWVFMLLAMCFAGYSIYVSFVEPYVRSKQAPLPVAVLFPKLDSVVGEDAKRQCEGFSAFANKNDADRRCKSFIASAERNGVVVFNFDYPFKKEDSLTERDSAGSDASARREPIKPTQTLVMDQIKKWYSKDEIRIFVVTMSGAVKSIKTEFNVWAEEQPIDERPVLVATVASAPEIAEDTSTIFRYYIRSRDETDVFSTYIESMGSDKVIIFYIDDGENGYGVSAKNTFKKRLDGSQLILDSIKVPIAGTNDEVANDFKASLNDTLNRKSAVVIIVGYGSMINQTLDLIRETRGDDGPHEGKILITSAFTEKDWRPDFSKEKWNIEGKEFAKRIYSVGPNTGEDDDDKKGVVYLFSKLTLERADSCSHARGIEDFKACWFNNELMPGVEDWVNEIEFTEDGDSHVSLKLIKEEW